MKRLLLNSLSTAVLAVGFLGGSGCTDENTEMLIVANLARPAGSCVARADLSATTLGNGFLDVGLKLDYVASLLVANQLTPRGDKSNLRTETMQVSLQGAEVRLLDAEDNLLEEFTVPASGVIFPEPAVGPGLGIATVTLVPATTGAELAQDLENRGQRRTLIAEAKVFGTTLGGLEVESGTFTYVIEVCEGCLIAFPTEALRLEDNTLFCDQESVDENEVPCRIGQDEGVDCRLCSGNEFCRP